MFLVRPNAKIVQHQKALYFRAQSLYAVNKYFRAECTKSSWKTFFYSLKIKTYIQDLLNTIKVQGE